MSALRRFGASRTGVAALEFSLIAPLLMLLVLGSFVAFIAFRESTRAETATFTVADIVSRQNTVSKSFLDTNFAMFLKMTSASAGSTSFRISSLKMANGKLAVDWSYSASRLKALADADIPVARLPIVADGDSLLMVETGVAFAPLAEVPGFSASTFEHMAANRPRFTSAIVKSD